MLLSRARGPSSVRAPSTIWGGTTPSRTMAAAHLVKDTKEKRGVLVCYRDWCQGITKLAAKYDIEEMCWDEWAKIVGSDRLELGSKLQGLFGAQFHNGFSMCVECLQYSCGL
jgi:hypothetical protein